MAKKKGPATPAVTEAAEALLDSVLLDGGEEAGAASGEAPAGAVPPIDSPDWTAHVLCQLRPNEVYDGRPTYAGVRRLAAALLGVVIDTAVRVVQAPSASNGGRACVEVGMTIDHPADYHWLGAYAGRVVRYADASDLVPVGDDDVFGKYHATASCATRTKARVLRDAFRLVGVYLREETSEAEPDARPRDERVNDAQARVIKLLCSPDRLNIDAARYLRGVWRLKEPDRKGGYEDLNQLPHPVAAEAVRRLQHWQQGDHRKDIPPELAGKYDPRWADDLECLK